MKKRILAGLVVLAMASASQANIIGSGELVMAGVGQIDYEVDDLTGTLGYYEYRYELESTHNFLELITLDVPIANYFAAGWFANGDLSYGDETIVGTDVLPTGVDPDPTNISWEFNASTVDFGEDSTILYLRSYLRPVLTHISVTNAAPQGDGRVLAPGVPAPGAALLVGLGVGLVGWLKRRMA